MQEKITKKCIEKSGMYRNDSEITDITGLTVLWNFVFCVRYLKLPKNWLIKIRIS
jgi:hypothetical protein